MTATDTKPAGELRSMLRFGLRDVLMLMLVVGLGLGWWVDRREMESRVELGELRIKKLQDHEKLFDHLRQAARDRVQKGIEEFALRPSPFATSQELLESVRRGNATDKSALASLGGDVSRARGEPFADDAIPELIGLLADSDQNMQTRAACALGAIAGRPELTIPALIPLVSDPSPLVRRHVAEALAEFKADARAAIPALRVAMLDDDSETAAHAALCLIQIDSRQQIGPRLMELVKSRHADNRWRAVAHLQYYFPPDEVEDALTRAFADEPNELVRDAIATALNRLP